MTEKVSLLVGDDEFAHWTELELTLSLDTFATLSFRAPFESDRPEFWRIFEPFSFKALKVLLDGVTLFTGTLLNIDLDATADKSEVEVTGYALPAGMCDCNAPGDKVPFEYKKVTLRQIAEALAGEFGVKVDFRVDPGRAFAKVKLESDKVVFDFLTELAQQRKLVFSSTPEGVLLCWQSVKVGNPVAYLLDTESPLTRIKSTFAPQEYFSQITGFGNGRRGVKGKRHTEKNAWLKSPLRPNNFHVSDTDPADVADATRARLGRMFANMASWEIPRIPTWRDPQGALWQPNTTVTVLAPKAAIRRKSELLVREVKLRQSAEEESASLQVVLPGAFSAEIPSFLPWQEPI